MQWWLRVQIQRRQRHRSHNERCDQEGCETAKYTQNERSHTCFSSHGTSSVVYYSHTMYFKKDLHVQSHKHCEHSVVMRNSFLLYITDDIGMCWAMNDNLFTNKC